MRAIAAHGVLRVAAPLVTLHLGRGTTPQPVIIESRVQRERVELLHGRISIERVVQLPRAIEVLEQHAQAVFRYQAATRAALNADAAVHIESLLAIGPHVFERASPLPRHALGLRIRPHAAGAEHVRLRHHNAERGHAQQVALEGGTVERASCDVRVERVVRGRAENGIHVRGLVLHLVEKDVGMRLHLRGLEAITIADGANQCGAADGNSATVEQAARRGGRDSVRGVSNGNPGRGAGDGDREIRRVEPSAARRKLEILDEGEEAAPVDRARRRRGEVMIRQAENLVLHQLGTDQEVGGIGRIIQTVNRQHVCAGQQQIEAGRQVDVLEGRGAGEGAIRRGRRVPKGHGWRVASRDFRAIEIHDAAVIVLQPQCERGIRTGCRNRERQPDIGRADAREHLRLHIGGDERAQAAAASAARGQGFHGQPAASGVADEAEARIEGTERTRRSEELQL